jgi:hypothetical protein
MDLGNSVQFYPSCHASESEDVKRLEAKSAHYPYFLEWFNFHQHGKTKYCRERAVVAQKIPNQGDHRSPPIRANQNQL